jgi:hypothetical protein
MGHGSVHWWTGLRVGYRNDYRKFCPNHELLALKRKLPPKSTYYPSLVKAGTSTTAQGHGACSNAWPKEAQPPRVLLGEDESTEQTIVFTKKNAKAQWFSSCSGQSQAFNQLASKG